MNSITHDPRQSKRLEETCQRRYLRGVKNQNGEHLVNMCESTDQTDFKHKSYSLGLEVYFSIESTNYIKIKIT